MASQHSQSAIQRLNDILRRLAEALERHRDNENDRLAALVQAALHERENA